MHFEDQTLTSGSVYSTFHSLQRTGLTLTRNNLVLLRRRLASTAVGQDTHHVNKDRLHHIRICIASASLSPVYTTRYSMTGTDANTLNIIRSDRP